jgi:beta-galactosidase
MSRFPRLIHTEWGGDSHVGRHNSGPHLRRQIANHITHEENPGVALSSEGEARASLDGDWSESYILDLMEWHLQVQNSLPNLAGTAQWVFKDFGTPLRPENPIPYVNQKGLVDRSGTPKDVYYLFQAYQTNTPVCHIESPTWPIRCGESGALKRVRVYSNCERVELFVNGRSQGTKFPNANISPAAGLVWFVPLYLGENEIQATAVTTSGQTVEHSITQTLVPNGVTKAAGMQGWFTSAGSVTASAGSVTALAGSEQVKIATVQLVTKDGIPVLTDEHHLTFALSGSGRLLINQGAPYGCRVVETANGRASITIFDADETTQLHVTSEELPPIQIS